MSKNLIARISVALVAIPLILWICYQGGYWLSSMVTLFVLIAMNEFLYNEKCTPKNIAFWVLNIVLLFSFIPYLPLKELVSIDNSIINTLYYRIQLFVMARGPVVIILLIGMLFSVSKESPSILFTKYSRLLFGFIYISMLYPFIVDIGFFKYLEISGGDWLLFLFAILWTGDSMALFIGKAFGKHKLAPSVSPNKTVEGFVGGLLGAMIVGVIMYFWKFDVIAWYHIMLIAIGCSIFGQLGDLVESMWKRSINIKDSSNLIPGHGGILDRFDSLLFAAPFMYFYIQTLRAF